jgi:MoxR-like ATPase
MKKLEVASLNLDDKIQMLESIFDNMHIKSGGFGQTGYMLGGDTGVGKTSFIRDLGTLLGLSVVIIETPHIVEEHIIDIPFIVVKPSGVSKTQHQTVDTKSSQAEFDIKFAKSHLHSTLVASKKVSDSEMLSNIKRRPDLLLIWEKLGGSATEIPDEISEIRAKYDVILFLDEYFRQTSSSIRNMLRSILNGRIGSQELPDNVYVIFASNLVDQGIGDILENEDFQLLNFDKPSVDGWFAYMLSKYKNHKSVKLDDELVSKMYELMKKEEALSYDDDDADVRISPRRWEQLMLYISAHLPVKNEDEANLLLKNVQINFKNYQTGEMADLGKKVLDVVKDIIKNQSKNKIQGSADSVDDADWRDTLKHQIQARIKIGADRKYIPVIGGLPGAGKTQHITQLALELALVPIFVDVQNLSPEEVIGVPLSKKQTGDEIEVDFSRPPLYDNIMTQMEKGEKRLPKALVQAFGQQEGEAKLAQHKKQEVKYLIFFDELNRTSTKVFNAIRKVLLEKEFNDDYRLPENAVIVAAVNPIGKGTQELTKHVRDVFDVIPVGISWQKFNNHLDALAPKLQNKLGVDKELVDIARSALSAFIEHFRAKSGKREQGADPHFYLQIGATPLYMSPRELTAVFNSVILALKRSFRREIDLLSDPDHDPGESEYRIRQAMARAFAHGVEFTVNVKHSVDAPEFQKELEEWFITTDKISLGSIFKKKVESVKNLADLLKRPFQNMEENLFDDIEFVNYITSVDAVVFKEDLIEFLLTQAVTDFETAFAKTHKQKVLNVKKKAAEIKDKEISKIEFIAREIIHAIKLHDISNKMMEMTQDAVREVLERITDVNIDAVEDVINLASDLRAYIAALRKA